MANLEVIALDASTPQLRAPGAGDSYAMPRPVIQQVGVLTTDVKVVERSATWNNAAVTFTGYKINITDTASAAGSLLLDLQVGGISKADISKSGVLGFTGQFGYKASIKGSSNGSRVLAVGYEQSGTVTEQCWIGYSVGFRCVTSGHFSWGTSSGSGLYDLALERDAANTLAQRNGVNAQAFRVYNTYTDASNYERGVFDWMTTPNTLTIGVQAAGTGVVRDLCVGGLSSGFGGMTYKASGVIVVNPDSGATNQPAYMTSRYGVLLISGVANFATGVAFSSVGGGTISGIGTYLKITTTLNYGSPSTIVIAAPAPGGNNLNGGNLLLSAQDGGSVAGNNNSGGNVVISGGLGYGTGHNGYVLVQNLPTASAGLPTGALWNNAGVLSIA